MTTLAPGYEPASFESRLYAQWEASGAFAPQGDGPAYTILLPPPNVTGTLHMGHAFQHTLEVTIDHGIAQIDHHWAHR